HIARQLKTVSDRLSEILSDKNVKAVTESLANIRKLSNDLARVSDEIGPLIDNANATLVHARAASSRLPALITQVRAALTRYEKLADQIGRAVAGVGQASRHIGSLTPNAREMLMELNQTMDNLDDLVRELKHRPNSILFGKPVHPGPGEHTSSGG